MDIRENLRDDEDFLRSIITGLLKSVWTVMPATVTEDTQDGHVATAQPTIKREVTDPASGLVSYEDHPVHPDIPIHHLGGGGVSTTHPTKSGDTGAILYASRAIDSWFQSDGSQQPIDFRAHCLADGMYLSGVRSTPRMLQQVSKDSTQTRSDDKHHVADLHPQDGIKHKSVDPSTPIASDIFDPYAAAAKYFESRIHPTSGIAHDATDGGTTHNVSLTHEAGFIGQAANGAHKVTAHPTDGAKISANNDEHVVKADPTAGVMISSNTAIGLSAPSLSLPLGSVLSAALAPGAASDSIGGLSGDLSGALPNAQVVGLTNVTNANLLPVAASDPLAALAGVVVGGLYVNKTALTGCNLLVVRLV